MREEQEWHPCLSHGQIDWIQSQVADWIRIHHENHNEFPNDADADHSALLRYLLRGNKPHDLPPPTMFSYPAHDAADGVPVSVVPEGIYETDDGRVVVNQNDRFRWFNDDHIIHEPTGQIYKVIHTVDATWHRGQYKFVRDVTYIWRNPKLEIPLEQTAIRKQEDRDRKIHSFVINMLKDMGCDFNQVNVEEIRKSVEASFPSSSDGEEKKVTS